MKLPALLVSDTHFVDEPACAYRWGLWPWLRQTIKEEKVKTVCHLGDLVDRKDNHPASLVNRLADEIRKTRAETAAEMVFMPGNHDWLKDGEEFFRWLRHLDGVHYPTAPWEHPDAKGPSAYFLPYSKDPVRAWAGLDFSHYDYLFMHQTVEGSVTSNGEKLPGEMLPALNAGKVYSGDIHVPQVVKTPAGAVEYVGSPYHVHFGDNFSPRCVLIEAGGRAINLKVPGMPKRVTVRAHSLAQLKSFYWQDGDQGKVRLMLPPEERADWARLRREAAVILRSRGVHVHGIELVATGGDGKRITHARAARMSGMSPGEAIERYVRDEELGGDALDVALDLV